MKPRRIHSTIADFLIVVMIFTGCAGSGGGGGGTGVAPRAAVTYTLPFLPIEIAYDFINDKLSVSISNKIQTPLGSFGFSGGVVLEEKKYIAAERKFKSERKLKIEAGDKLYIYKLENGRPYNIHIPTDVYNNTRLKTTGPDEDITISIPHPTDETIAGLKEQIAALERQLIERDQRTSQSDSPAEVSEAPSGDEPAPREETTGTSSPSYPESEAGRGGAASGIYKGSAGVADIRMSEDGGFSFVLTTPRCSREAIGRAVWTSDGLARSVSPIREDAARMPGAAPTESTCVLTFTFSGNEFMVEKVGNDCFCNYTGLYSFY